MISIPDFTFGFVEILSSWEVGVDNATVGWLLTETLFLETLILVSFSVISISVRLNSSK